VPHCVHAFGPPLLQLLVKVSGKFKGCRAGAVSLICFQEKTRPDSSQNRVVNWLCSAPAISVLLQCGPSNCFKNDSGYWFLKAALSNQRTS
jgi:hypothetical protein